MGLSVYISGVVAWSRDILNGHQLTNQNVNVSTPDMTRPFFANNMILFGNFIIVLTLILQSQLRSVAPPIYGYNSSGNSSTTSSGGSYLQSNNSTESFVDQLKRSASSVNPKNRAAPIAKPIRRSKSQRSQNFVTSIQHGGSVTLVSLNGELDEQGKNPNSEIKHVHHHHFVQDWDGNGMHPGGSQTLPNRKSGQLTY